MEPEIDLRSDTMTRPTEAMRTAMAQAEVGNSALGEDPTVQALEQDAAELFDKEAAVFCTSGTMANLAAMIAWTQDVERPEIVAESTAHVLLYESSSISRVAHAQARPIVGERGHMPLERVREELRTAGGPSIKPETALVCLEQTHNQSGGVVLDPDHMEAIAELADSHEVPVHIDGARLMNASVAVGVEASELTQHGDSVMLALTKGLGAPVGSVLAGPEGFVTRARRAKALLGGGMRQAGHIAAAGRIALDEGPAELSTDHENAARLAEGIAGIGGLGVDPGAVETNIVFFDVSELGVTAAEFAKNAEKRGLGLDGMMAEHRVRAVTHRDVDAEEIGEAVERIEATARELT